MPNLNDVDAQDLKKEQGPVSQQPNTDEKMDPDLVSEIKATRDVLAGNEEEAGEVVKFDDGEEVYGVKILKDGKYSVLCSSPDRRGLVPIVMTEKEVFARLKNTSERMNSDAATFFMQKKLTQDFQKTGLLSTREAEELVTNLLRYGKLNFMEIINSLTPGERMACTRILQDLIVGYKNSDAVAGYVKVLDAQFEFREFLKNIRAKQTSKE